MNEITNTNEQSIIYEINYLQDGITQKAKSCVKDAQRIGQLLCEVQTQLETCHSGRFPEWVINNCSISERTAYRYMDLYQYRLKIGETASFSEAYKQIEEIKQIEQKTENEKAAERVEVAYKTGVKPEGWRQHTDDKLLQQKKEAAERQKAYDENLKMQAERINREEEVRKQEQEHREKVIDNARKIMSEAVERAVKLESWRDKLNLSGNSEDVENMIIVYLDELENDSRRIECCHNIIKICKQIVRDLSSDNKDGFEIF